MNVGLYFGTFNPIHVGHLIIANHMVEHSDLDEVWLVVTPHNPFKKKHTLLDNHHRLELAMLATEKYPKIKPTNIEFDLPQPNYTVHTLVHIAEKYPQHKFSLIMGEDNLKSFHKWKNYETILDNHEIYCYPRITEGKAKTIFENRNVFTKNTNYLFHNYCMCLLHCVVVPNSGPDPRAIMTPQDDEGTVRMISS